MNQSELDALKEYRKIDIEAFNEYIKKKSIAFNKLQEIIKPKELNRLKDNK
jgi:hypothetical protein